MDLLLSVVLTISNQRGKLTFTVAFFVKMSTAAMQSKTETQKTPSVFLPFLPLLFMLFI